MNKLSFSEPVWLASDIHLGAHNPKTSAAFYEFLALARERANALILLGDIFDVWVGDDWIKRPAPWLDDALQQLKLTGQTIPLWLLGGNRDFLIGKHLADNLHARLITDQCILEFKNAPDDPHGSRQKYLLAHGDEFCTADRRYQRFRTVVRHPATQALFLKLPLSVRCRIAQRARQNSIQTERSPYDATYDVQDEELAAVLSALNLSTCIHGHTHRPGHYPLKTANSVTLNQPLTRWVLPDWEFDHLSLGQEARGGWMQIDQHGPALCSICLLKK